jgi:hypothetical protein
MGNPLPHRDIQDFLFPCEANLSFLLSLSLLYSVCARWPCYNSVAAGHRRATRLLRRLVLLLQGSLDLLMLSWWWRKTIATPK